MKGTSRKIASRKWERLFNFQGPLLRNGLPLMKNILTPLPNSILVTLRLMTGASAIDAAIQKKIFELGTIAVIISNKGIDDIMKIVKSLEISGLLIKSETMKRLKMK